MKKLTVVLALAAFAAALIGAMLELAPAPVALPASVAASLDASGVQHPVTAVLLNFRGYDTLLEVAVLLLALLGVLAAGVPRQAREADACAADPVLPMLARAVVPAMVPMAVYLLWAGAFRPGGAFQAGAVLAAAAVLLHLAGLLPGWSTPGRWLRWGCAGGLLIFLALAATPLIAGHALLQYPPAWAGLLILLIESALTVSLALILAGLFLFLTDGEGRRA